MNYRWLRDPLASRLTKPFVHVLFGARQTGKTTLLRELLSSPSLAFNLADPAERNHLLADIGAFSRACRALPAQRQPHFVFVDEAQTVPAVFDAVQSLYDQDKKRWRFVLCGSSARKLRLSGANLLPGRSLQHRLFPLTLAERPADEPPPKGARSPLPFPPLGDGAKMFPTADLMERLAFGDLPGIVLLADEDRAELLRGYVVAHLEEEIRREALVRDWGAFLRFLQFAAAESGEVVNYARIADDVGIAPVTVRSYFQLLEDIFVGFTVPGYSRSPRKNLTSTPRFFMFDLGIRHAAAGLTPSREIVKTDPGRYFEQWVGIELWKRLGYLGKGRLHHLRSKDGAEIDFLVEIDGDVIPIEAKWTERPKRDDARHVLKFLAERPKSSTFGFVVCRVPRPELLDERVMAIPWFCL
ncbi:MAG: ATP-binding protein [Steroidobacteraceae bacterium]